jgi:cell division protein FtsZ
MNEAALVNGGQAPAKPRRWTSILEIVANSSRRPSRQAEPVMSRDAAAAHAAEASLPLPEPVRSEPKAEAKAPAKAEAAKPQQPELGGLDTPPTAPSRGAGDDDLLDIPAFLRRQAN